MKPSSNELPCLQTLQTSFPDPSPLLVLLHKLPRTPDVETVGDLLKSDPSLKLHITGPTLFSQHLVGPAKGDPAWTVPATASYLCKLSVDSRKALPALSPPVCDNCHVPHDGAVDDLLDDGRPPLKKLPPPPPSTSSIAVAVPKKRGRPPKAKQTATNDQPTDASSSSTAASKRSAAPSSFKQFLSDPDTEDYEPNVMKVDESSHLPDQPRCKACQMPHIPQSAEDVLNLIAHCRSDVGCLQSDAHDWSKHAPAVLSIWNTLIKQVHERTTAIGKFAKTFEKTIPALATPKQKSTEYQQKPVMGYAESLGSNADFMSILPPQGGSTAFKFASRLDDAFSTTTSFSTPSPSRESSSTDLLKPIAMSDVKRDAFKVGSGNFHQHGAKSAYLSNHNDPGAAALAIKTSVDNFSNLVERLLSDQDMSPKSMSTCIPILESSISTLQQHLDLLSREINKLQSVAPSSFENIEMAILFDLNESNRLGIQKFRLMAISSVFTKYGFDLTKALSSSSYITETLCDRQHSERTILEEALKQLGILPS